MLSKEKILQTVKDLPDGFSIDDLFEKIVLMQKIEIGLEQSKAGLTVTTEEAKKKLSQWLLK